MKNLTGYLKKIPLLFSLSFFFFLLSVLPAHADDTFVISTDITHTIASDNTVATEITTTISSEITRVLSYYTAVIPQGSIQAACYNASDNKKITCSSTNKTNSTEILIDFNNSVITPKSPYKLKITYTSTLSSPDSYNIVSTIQNTTTNSITVIYPKTKGEPLWTSDPVQNIKSVGDNYQIQIEKPAYPTLSILFGKNVSYKFAISKTFVNTETGDNQTFEIITPADTQNQTIVWGDITPLPSIVEKDEDGNYIFRYVVPAGKSIDCTISGYIMKHDVQQESEDPASFLSINSGYWNTTSSTELTKINAYLSAKGLTIPDGFSNIEDVDANTQELIYKYLDQYVIDRLTPQQDLTQGIITDNRKGFDNLISNPVDATPIDYSDFLITIFRKYGIPARQVIGFVSNISGYTSDGFYDYWVEAYDFSQKKWITIDPFLEDYFSKSLYNSVFFDHISILTRGESPVSPKLTFYKDTDFEVTSNTQDEVSPNLAMEAQLVFDNSSIISKYIKALVNISNTGNIAITDYQVTKSSIDDIQKYIDPVNNINSQVILPKENATLQFNILNTGGLSNTYIDINFENHANQKDIMLQTNPNIVTPLYIKAIVKIISVLAFAGIVYLLYFLVNKVIMKKRHER